VASLAPTFGRGAMSNTWQDIKNANVIVVMGGNAAEAHPCGFKWVTEAKHFNHAKLVVIDPRFTRTASVADVYAPIRPGTDIAFLNGVIRHLLEKDAIQHAYVRAYTNAGFIVKQDVCLTVKPVGERSALCSVVIYALIGSELLVGRPRVGFEEDITKHGCGQRSQPGTSLPQLLVC
jgi:anaerobic selenocysteine-containing dehydrogenase